MASFLSTFSIFFLVLLNGFFAIPIIKQQNSSSTFFDHSTTGSELNTRSVPVDATSPLVDSEHEHAFPEHMESNISTPGYNSTEEHTGQGLRGLQELLNTSPLALTTDAYNSNELFSSTLGSTTDALTHVLRSVTVGSDNDTDTDTDNEQDKRDMPVEITTTWTRFSTSTPSDERQQVSTSEKSTVQDSETKIKPKHPVKPKRPVKPKHAAKANPESDVEPEPKSKDDSESEQHEDESHPHPHPEHEHNHKHEHKPVEKEPMKSFPSEAETGSESEAKPTKKAKIPSYDEGQADNSKEPTAPTAYFDRDALQNVSYPFNNALVLDENNNLNVTDIPRRFSSSTMKSSQEAKLNQGKKPLHAEEKESDH